MSGSFQIKSRESHALCFVTPALHSLKQQIKEAPKLVLSGDFLDIKGVRDM